MGARHAGRRAAIGAVAALAALPLGISQPAGGPACRAESEPNDQPPDAEVVAGGDCIAGEFADGDQDIFVWSVSDADARRPWTITVSEVRDHMVQFKLLRLVLDEAGNLLGTEELYAAGNIEAGAPAVADGILLTPGLYHIGASSTGSGDYTLAIDGGDPLELVGDAEPNDDADAASPIAGAFAVGGDLADSGDVFRWTLGPDDAKTRWHLALRAALGTPVQLAVEGPSGTVLADRSVDANGQIVLGELGLDAGDYVLRLSSSATAPTPYVLSAAPGGERAPGAEEEPNDEPGTAFAATAGEPFRGSLSAPGDLDHFRFIVDESLAATQFDVKLFTDSPLPRSVCVTNEAGEDLACRDATGGVAIRDLLLPAGVYLLRVRGESLEGDSYLVRIDPTSAPVMDFETEPNEMVATATPFGAGTIVDGATIRGRLSGRDVDTYHLAVDGEPQLWRVELAASGGASLALAEGHGGQAVVARTDDGGGVAELVDLYLLPGDHWLRVDGGAASYAISLEALGPPDPASEHEPNNDVGRAELLTIGDTRTGRLPAAEDRDLYRFSLAAEEHVAIIVEPGSDAAASFGLSWGGVELADQRSTAIGVPVEYDAVLPPGDYVLALSPTIPGEERYTVTLDRRDPFDLPVDLEPNDAAGSAAPLPADQTITGAIIDHSDDDWYRFEPPADASAITVDVAGDVDADATGTVTVALFDADGTDLGLADDGGGRDEAANPGTGELLLRVQGAGEYRIDVRFDDAPVPESPAELPLSMAVSAATSTVAAHYPDGQHVAATVELDNESDDELELRLDTAITDTRWAAALDAVEVTIPGRTRLAVPLEVAVPPDAWLQPVEVTVRASTADGSQQTAAVEIAADRDAPPLAPAPAWSLPESMLGGLNVAAVDLGAQPAAATDGQPVESVGRLFDGLALPGLGFVAEAAAAPVTVGVDLAGDGPLPIVGVVLHPEPLGALTSDVASSHLDRFAIEVSVDGVTYETVLEGRLRPQPLAQAYAFDAPVDAAFARLVMISGHAVGTGRMRLGELAVVAAPGVVPDGLEPRNIAAPELGGHVVRAVPPPYDPPHASDVLRGDGIAEWAPGTAEWVIGFAANRAALVTSLQWVDLDGSDPQAQLTSVDVAVSTSSPSGPWEHVASSLLDRSASVDGAMTLALDVPVWARYVRVSARSDDGIAQAQLPDTIRIFEAPTGDSYRSVVAEWGGGSAGAFELATGDGEIGAGDTVDAAGEPGAAAPLALGDTVRDRVQVDVDVDWYRIEVPPGQNRLDVTVAGEPFGGAHVTLHDDAGAPLELVPSGQASEGVTTATVEPGATYLLRVEQPLPSMVFAFDTSISLANYEPAIYAGLQRYAGGVEPGREVVRIIPFGEPPLLDSWLDDPYALQNALRNYPRTALSSDSIGALTTATEQMATQPGVTGIILLTDAETSLGGVEEMWAGLDAQRPQIFAVHIGAASEEFPTYAAMMRDWAGVNAGFYGYAATQAELDVAFERAATVMRRPVEYELTVEASYVDERPGSIAVTAAVAEPGATAAPAAVAGDVAVELIFDTSGSMLQQMEGGTRADVAKHALTELLTTGLPPGTPVALRVFGTTPDSCETNLAVPLGPLDPAAMSAAVAAVPIVDGVRTPLGASLQQVANDLAGAQGPQIVVLVTDGEETCDGDPEAAIRDLVAQGVDVHVNIVGFAIEDDALAAQFAEWAAIGQGRYIDAADAGGLNVAVAEAVQAPFRVLDATGAVVASGVVGGDPVEVPPGTYIVEVLSSTPRRFDGIIVGGGDAVTVTLD